MLQRVAVALVLWHAAAGAHAMKAPVPCALLTKEEVVEAINATVSAGEARISTASLGSCSFRAKGGGDVLVLVRLAPGKDWQSEQVARMYQGVRMGTYRMVEGLGERAFLFDMGSAGAVLCVFLEGDYLQISLLRLEDPSKVAAAAEQLARRALERMSTLR